MAIEKISAKYGKRLLDEILHHDDGVANFGGETLFVVGERGSGKSTFLLQLAQFSRYIRKFNKAQYVSYLGRKNPPAWLPKPHPETVVFRGTKYSNWANLIPENWDDKYPFPKPVHLYLHENDDITFYYDDEGTKIKIPNLPEIIEYDTAEDLNNLIKKYPGHIHVVYEPQKFYLDVEFVERFRARNLETLKFKERKKIEKMPVAPSIFWFVYFEIMLSNRPAPYITFVFDEAHQLIGNAKGEKWHLNEWFKMNAIIDARRSNVTIFFATQQLRQIDYRLIDPVSTFVWLKSAILPGFSQFKYKNITGECYPGLGLIERRAGNYGRFEFPRTKNQKPNVLADGVFNA